jgi:hypothetical protein
MRNLLPVRDTVQFTLKERDGRSLEVIAFGKVIAGEYSASAHVEDLYIRVYRYENADDLDGQELLRSDLGAYWDTIEDYAVCELCEDQGAA